MLGIGSAFIWSFGVAFILFKAIDITIGLRISEEEELVGTNLSEHAAKAYANFQTTE